MSPLHLLEKLELGAGREADEILALAKKLEEIEETEWVAEKDIVKVLEHVMDDISDLVERKGIEIEEEYPDTMKKVKGYYSLNTLFTQLLVTRIQISKCNKIKIYAREREEDILLKIEDDEGTVARRHQKPILRRSLHRRNHRSRRSQILHAQRNRKTQQCRN
ncbi:hypothetical protein AKJ36_01715 [candidate division MSBL1 archaeon SCGC-AAA259I07]|uniref:Uncharacterized protein n=1 Tax=candidate division MSBL1 archaeon SCGC-AAA259I07 TaxID=1698266 RepID=A0A133ULE3_9EURY|nr:hypothetical protein AKJ36_01715 [candidate division MSBL1 archaeon SCGC-AAA259I07]